jgi:lipid II:glycine glycyltransferase (peptidoglycan interpeptide bridge formation enzyme)
MPNTPTSPASSSGNHWTPRQITQAATWDDVLFTLPHPHILQSWAWGQFKSRHGWSATRISFEEGEQTIAAASVLQRKVPRMPVSILYVPRGPVLDWTDTERAEATLAHLESLARRRRALFIKIDPDVLYPGDGAAEAASKRPACAQQIARMLTRRGWRFSNEQIQFRNTALLDLRPPEDQLLAAMKQKTRYNVRLAGRKGVTVRRGTSEDTHIFYELYVETSRRDGFLIRPFEYYLDAWGSFLDCGLAHLLLAEVEGEATAGLMLFTFGTTAWYMYGASSDRHRRLMPNNLLQWEAMRLARVAGCTLYDLWGAPDHLDESDPMWGVVRFKLGLGSRLAEGLGAWDYPTNGLAYRFYTTVMPRYLGWLRRVSGQGDDGAG